MAKHDIALIDFEASCLPEYGQSYPIEVAVARTDGESRAWLIHPLESWQYWDWSPEAEDLHGISRAMLQCDGLPAAQVLTEMSDFVVGFDVYSDAELDAYWIDVLCDGLRAKLPFPIRFLGEWMMKQGFSRPQVIAALDEAKTLLPKEHFAREDAKRLAMVARLLMEAEPA